MFKVLMKPWMDGAPRGMDPQKCTKSRHSISALELMDQDNWNSYSNRVAVVFSSK